MSAQINPRVLLFIILSYISLIFLFGWAYYALSDGSWSKSKVHYSDAMFISVSTQSLLGHGSVDPISGAAQSLIMIQCSLTFLMIIIGAYYGMQDLIQKFTPT